MTQKESANEFPQGDLSKRLKLLASFEVGDRVICSLPVEIAKDHIVQTDGVPALIQEICLMPSMPFATLLRGLELVPLSVSDSYFADGHIVKADASHAQYDYAFKYMEEMREKADWLRLIQPREMDSYNYTIPMAS